MYLLRSQNGLRAVSKLFNASAVCASNAEISLQHGGVRKVPFLLRGFAQLVSFPLAQTGEGISECELVSWAVKPGDVVGPFDKLCDVQSDKASIEITSRYGGKVLALHHPVGAMVKVGAPLVQLEVADDVQVAPEHLSATAARGTTAATPAAAAAAAATAPDGAADGGGNGAPDGNAALSQPAAAAFVAVTEEVTATEVAVKFTPAPPMPTQARALGRLAVSASPPPPPPPGHGRVQASPAVRAYAREYGVEIDQVEGTGPGGRITRADVARFLEQRGSGVTIRADEDGDSDGGGAAVLQAADFLGPAAVDEIAGRLNAAAAAPAAAAAAAGGSVRPSRGPRATDEPLAQYRNLAAVPSRTTSGGGGEGEARVLPLRGYRRAMVAAMTTAAAVPVFHFHDQVTMDRLLAVRDVMRAFPPLKVGGGGGGPGSGPRLTLLPLIVKALSAALSAHPHLNASLANSGTELVVHPHHNIGVAVATPNGLVVPNIKQVERKSVAQIATELALMYQLASAGRLPPEALTGGTITISNIGSIGGTYATPLVSPPEVAIVALGRMQVLPRYPNTSAAAGQSPNQSPVLRPPLQPIPTSIMPVSWGADHRVVDGAALAEFSNSWRELLEQPERLLLNLS